MEIKRLTFESVEEFWQWNFKSIKSLQRKNDKGTIESSAFLYDSNFKTNDSEGKILAAQDGNKVDVYIIWNNIC